MLLKVAPIWSSDGAGSSYYYRGRWPFVFVFVFTSLIPGLRGTPFLVFFFFDSFARFLLLSRAMIFSYKYDILEVHVLLAERAS